MRKALGSQVCGRPGGVADGAAWSGCGGLDDPLDYIRRQRGPRFKEQFEVLHFDLSLCTSPVSGRQPLGYLMTALFCRGLNLGGRVSHRHADWVVTGVGG
jgi:hypothetical protein